MSMNKFVKQALFALIIALLVGGVSNNVFAEDFTDVEHPVGTNLNGDHLFKAENIYPGWSKSVVLRVKNKNETDRVNLYFNFDAKGDKKLADKLKLYVIRIKDNSYRIGGVGDHWTLKQADEDGLYVDRLNPGEATQYKVKIVFDKDAGNEYQGLKAKFNIDFELKSQTTEAGVTEAENEQQILTNQGRENFTGNAPTEESGENSVEEGGNEKSNVAGANEVKKGKTLGEEMGCNSLPRWVWVLATMVFLGLSLFSTQKTRKERAKQHFVWQLSGVIGVIVLWYFFDKCYYYKWFPVMTIIIGILNHLYYQKFRSIKKS